MSDSRSYASARLSIARIRVTEDTTLHQAAAHVCRVSARALRLARVSVWFFEPDGESLKCAHLLVREGPPGPDIRILTAEAFPRYMAALRKNRWICATDARNDPDTSEFRDGYLVPLGITSMLDAPVFHDGEVVGIVCHEHIGPMRTWSPEDRGFAGSVADILGLVLEQHERMHAQAQLREAEERRAEQHKMEALGRLASAVAHDFNNLLAAVDAYAASIAKRNPEIEEAAKIRDVSARGAALTRQLLAFGRPVASSRRSVDLGHAVAGLVPILTTLLQGACSLSVDARTNEFFVHADPIEIQQIVLNLALNARDAMPDGGTLSLRLFAVPKETSPTERPSVCMEISDTGLGMEPDVRKRAFEPFFTTKEPNQGTGLGLATVFSITRELAGFVELETGPGEGSIFRIILPVL